jgi:hypothetical protein
MAKDDAEHLLRQVDDWYRATPLKHTVRGSATEHALKAAWLRGYAARQQDEAQAHTQAADQAQRPAHPQELDPDPRVCTWCATAIDQTRPVRYPVTWGRGTVYTCSEEHQAKLTEALG